MLPKLQKGYLAPAAIIILAGIILLVAATIYFNGKLIQNSTPSPQPTPPLINTPTPTSTPDPTANWKTYTNQSNRFEIKYPESLYKISKHSTETSIYLISINDTDQENAYQDVLPITINITPKSKNISTDIKDLFTETGSIPYAKDLVKDKQPQNFSIGGTNGYILNQIGAGPFGIEREIVVTKYDKIFNITVENSNTKEPLKYKNLVSQILSTFKFTN